MINSFAVMLSLATYLKWNINANHGIVPYNDPASMSKQLSRCYITNWNKQVFTQHLVNGRSNCNGLRMKERTKAQRSKCSSWFLIRIVNTEQKTIKRQKRTVLNGEIKHRTENKHPRNTSGKGLPKYDSQSETTNDTCLWLRTIPGQTQNHNIENGT